MDTELNPQLLDIIQGLLSMERMLDNRLAASIAAALGVDDPLEGLTADRLGRMLDYELELLLSPLFTPAFDDRCACEPALPLGGVPAAAVPGLVAALVARGIRCDLVFGDGRVTLAVPEVVIDRHVRLLRLSGVVDDTVAAHFEGVDNPTRYRCICLARRRVWQSPERAELLKTCLDTLSHRKRFTDEKLRFLSDFVHTYHPQGVEGLLAALYNLVEAYHRDREHPIFNEQLEEHQGVNIRSRYCGTEVKAYRVRMARTLLEDFGKKLKHLDV